MVKNKSKQSLGFGDDLDEILENPEATVDYAALLQIAIDDKLNSFLAKGSIFESLPGSAFSGRNHSLGSALVL